MKTVRDEIKVQVFFIPDGLMIVIKMFLFFRYVAVGMVWLKEIEAVYVWLWMCICSALILVRKYQ